MYKAGHTLWQYVPSLAVTVGGYALSSLAKITANAATVIVTAADCADAANLPAHFAQVVKLSGAPV